MGSVINKFKYLILFFIFLIPSGVFADNADISLDCPEVVVQGETVECDLSVWLSGVTIKGVEFNYNYSGLSYDSYILSDIFSSSSVVDKNSVSLIMDDGVINSNSNIGKLKLIVPSDAKSNQEYKINLTDIIISDEDDNSINLDDVSKTIRVKSSDNTLSSLTVSGISFDFSKDTTSYNLSTELDSINIDAKAVDSKASVTGTGSKKLEYGSNKFEIIVTSENGDTKKYELNITRIDDRSDDNTLSSLSISNASIDFNKFTHNYSVIVDYKVDSINVKAIPNDSKATISGTGNHKLEVGSNLIELIVISELGNTRRYIINVERVDGRSSDNKLSSLKVSSGKLEFDKDTNNYTLTVKNEVDSINVDAVPNDNKASVSVEDSYKLEVGSNTIEIVVTSENGSSNTYILTVIREDESNKVTQLSNDNTLKSLNVFGYNINFKSDVLEYRINVDSTITKLSVNAIPNDSKAKVTINNNQVLNSGENIININVVAENGNGRTYKLIVNKDSVKVSDNLIHNDKNNSTNNDLKDENKNSGLSAEIIVCIICGVILISLFGFVLYTKYGKKEKLIPSTSDYSVNSSNNLNQNINNVNLLDKVEDEDIEQL